MEARSWRPEAGGQKLDARSWRLEACGGGREGWMDVKTDGCNQEIAYVFYRASFPSGPLPKKDEKDTN